MEGILSIVHGNEIREYESKQIEICRKWLTKFCTEFADKSPVDPDVFYLPMLVIRCDIYDEMCKEMYLNEDQAIPSLSTFYYTWTKFFPNLKTPRKTKLGRCDFCTTMQNQMMRCNSITKQQLRVKQAKHLQQMNYERARYYIRRGSAEVVNKTVTSLILDYCDPIKVPHQSIFPKSWLTKKAE